MAFPAVDPGMSMAYPHARHAHAAGFDLDRLERLRRLARALDTRWTIPGTRIGFGWDGIASLVPVAGDTLTALVSLHIIREAAALGVPARGSKPGIACPWARPSPRSRPSRSHGGTR